MRYFASVCILVATASLALSQTRGSQFTGTITDSSGAVLPGAEVAVTEVNTGIVRNTSSNDLGYYTVPLLEPGNYRITVQKEAFRPIDRSGVTLQVNQTARIDFVMEVGSVTEVVHVEGRAQAIQTDTSDVGNVVDSTQIGAIPMNGRTGIAGLVALAPGVQQAGGGFGQGSTGTGAGQTPQIGSSITNGITNMTVDGVPNNDMLNERILITTPSLDAIGEFKVIANGASAEYGRGGAQIVVATKSGTNEFHGSLLYFNRNRAFSAKNFFATGLPKPAFNRNEFGGTLGGPIARDKLFFFAGFEGLRLRQSSTNLLAMPTEALKAGNFAGLPTIRDPFNGGALFTNNQIPATRFDPTSVRLLDYFSTPNLPGTGATGLGNNFVYNSPHRESNNRYSTRLDYHLNDSNKLSGRYFQVDNGPYVLPLATGSEKFGNWSGFGISTKNVGGSWLRLLGTRGANELTLGLNHEVTYRTAQNENLDTATLVDGLPPAEPGLGGLPNVTIVGFRGFSEAGGSGTTKKNRMIGDIFTLMSGSHTTKFGFEYQWASAYNFTRTQANFRFDARYSGHPFADYMLGYLNSASRGNRPKNERQPENSRYAGFVQDDWKVTQQLTLNLGLRYEYYGLFNDTAALSNFYPELGSIVILQGTPDPRLMQGLPILTSEQAGIDMSNYRERDFNDFGPRFGFAYRPFDSKAFVVRGSYGIYYLVIPAGSSAGRLYNNLPFHAVETFEPAPGTTPSLFFNQAFPGAGNLPSNPNVSAEARRRPTPYVQQWNMTFEYEALQNTTLRASYLGNVATKLQQNFNLNEPPPAAGQVQPRRPYQPFGPISYTWPHLTAATHQAQLGLVRRFAAGLALQFEYQFTRSLGAEDGAPLDNRNTRLDRGNADSVRRHYAISNYVYDLPFGPGKHFLSGWSGLPGKLVGGWQLAGVVTLSTGQPYSVTFNSGVLGWPNGRADIVGDPNLDDPTIERWFNPEAFARPQPFLFGNSAPNSLWGPSFNNWDLAIYKDTALSESVKLQFRTEFFNVLNHANFDLPASNISVPSTVGRSSQASDARNIQFALKLLF